MDFQIVFDTAKTVDEAIAAVEATLAERKFSVLWHLHINQKLAEKSLTIEPDVHVLEVCSAPRAKQAIDANPDVAAFLPCKIVVRGEGGTTRIALVRPTMLMQIMAEDRLQSMAVEVEDVLADAIRAAC